jgi:hypothetical protein
VEFDAFEIPTEDEKPIYEIETLPEDIIKKSKNSKKSSHRDDIAKASIPVAGAAAGVAAAFTIKSILKRKKNKDNS